MKKTINRGTVLNRFDSVLLAAMGEPEGFCSVEGIKWLELIKTIPYLEQYKKKILSAVLLYEGAHILVPQKAQDLFNLSKIQQEGIPITVHELYESDRLNKLKDLFKYAWSAARFIEGDPRFASIISWDELTERKPRRKNNIAIETEIENFNYYRGLLKKEVEFVSQLSPDLLNTFLAEQHSWQEYFTGRVERHKSSLINWSTNLSQSILNLMSLKILDADEVDPKGTLGIPDVFPNNYFENFENVDYQWDFYSNEDETFENYAERSLYMLFHNPDRFSKVHSFWRAQLELRSLMSISSDLNIPIHLRTSNNDFNYEIPQITKGDDNRIQLFKMYINGVNSIPRVETITDLLRLYNHKYVKRFRSQIQEWNRAVDNGEINILLKMKHDFELATKDLKQISELERIGNIMTIVSLPLGIAGLFTGLPIDFAFTAVGPALMLYSSILEKRANWVKFGSLE